MPNWTWTGFSPDGKPASGTVESESADEAYAKVSRNGNIVSSVTAEEASSKARSKRTADDVMLFSRQMHTLMKAGVPILRSLNGIAESTKNQTFAETVIDVRNELEQGRALSQAIRKHSETFGEFYANMIMVGETAGRLDDIFLQLYKYAEFDKDMRDRIKSAFRYPSFVVIAIAVAMVIVMTFVIPSFSKVYAGLGANLPIFTRLIIGVSDAFTKYFPFIGLGGVLGGFYFSSWKKTKEGRFAWHSFLLKLPVLGEIVLKASLARFSRGMALTLDSGLPILQSIDVVSGIVGNDVVMSKMLATRAVIERGGTLYSAYSGSGVFTPTVMQMLAVGEESGDVSGLLSEVAGMYERDIDIDIKSIGARIEPFLLIVLGAMVVVLALGVFLPVWNLGGALMGGK